MNKDLQRKREMPQFRPKVFQEVQEQQTIPEQIITPEEEEVQTIAPELPEADKPMKGTRKKR